jgi:N-acetylmuramoyl-L-alanine amidase
VIACPKIISRKEWGARAPTGGNTRFTRTPLYAVIHHGSTKTYCKTQSECARIVRSYQNYHIDTQKWGDIGYNFLVGEDGNVYEGRGWNAVGAHARGYNWNSIGICVIGDFTGVSAT